MCHWLEGWEPSVPIQLLAGHILGLLFIKVSLLLVACHDVQVVKVRVVIHRAAEKEAVSGHGAQVRGADPLGMLGLLESKRDVSQSVYIKTLALRVGKITQGLRALPALQRS